MKNILKKAAGTFAFLLIAGFSSQLSAQQSNMIEEVKLNNTDGFGKLRQLIVDNFDYTNPNLSEGINKSVIKFDVSKEGKITNVHAEGRCKYVSEELETVLSDLTYKFEKGKELPFTYVMPVEVAIAAR